MKSRFDCHQSLVSCALVFLYYLEDKVFDLRLKACVKTASGKRLCYDSGTHM